jgi:hypothetical protein
MPARGRTPPRIDKKGELSFPPQKLMREMTWLNLHVTSCL